MKKNELVLHPKFATLSDSDKKKMQTDAKNYKGKKVPVFLFIGNGYVGIMNRQD